MEMLLRVESGFINFYLQSLTMILWAVTMLEAESGVSWVFLSGTRFLLMTGVLTVDDWSPDIGVNDDISLASMEELELSGLGENPSNVLYLNQFKSIKI